MVCKLSNRINAGAKLEEMYNARFWFLTTIIHAIVFDANNFCHRISQLTHLTSPERFDDIKYAEQREESLQQIVSIPREESLPQIASGIMVSTTRMLSSRICLNKIYASTVKI